MQVLGIRTGPAVDADRATEAVAEVLADRGRVGVVRDGDATAERTTITLGAEGWTASGPDPALDDALDRLAPDHGYALVVDIPIEGVPTMTVGDVASADPTITAPTVDEIDRESVVETAEAGESHETLESLVAAVKRSPDAEYAGAIATFTGRVRAKEDESDVFTEALTFEHYEELATERMAALEGELEARDGVVAVKLHHRTGRIEYGEDIVFVVVLAGHREEAFRTVEEGIDRLKAEVPIFKKEVTVEEEFWVHERS
ncbi:MAG: molybdopterin synthase [Halodesulfurarchaeum sp.]